MLLTGVDRLLTNRSEEEAGFNNRRYVAVSVMASDRGWGRRAETFQLVVSVVFYCLKPTLIYSHSESPLLLSSWELAVCCVGLKSWAVGPSRSNFGWIHQKFVRFRVTFTEEEKLWATEKTNMTISSKVSRCFCQFIKCRHPALHLWSWVVRSVDPHSWRQGVRPSDKKRGVIR